MKDKKMFKHTRKFLNYFLVALFTGVLFSGCSSTRLVDVWKDDSYRPAPAKNVLVIAINNNRTKRRLWESTYVDALKKHGVQAVPSFKYYPDNAPEEKGIPDLFKNDFDRIVLIQMVSQKERKYFVPGTMYYQPWGFRRWYGWWYSRSYFPGYVEKERITQLETTVWEPGEDGKMIWSGVTETVDPNSPQEFSKDVSSKVIPRLFRDRILIQRAQSREQSF